ncbi:hypothetical protein ELQ90_02895 [Labedella phragmitis]|uniref:Nucleotidyl transferase AbiEii/AbiGii toxin family protein n=1 Tax=Labedella phragmitis TaxID=2498849 RepID=A0A3S5CFF7_9MICO|nr:hypothetical protein [Labedella phragmitis]RWZ52901.1 hypothetical protein ELQ90_02895 [Labedella phragmitis]
MATALDREALVRGLRELILELRSAGEVAGIRIVGGAALALRYFDRGTTQDLDSLHVNPGSDEAVAAAAARVAAGFGWDDNWLNFAVTRADALPTMGRRVEWETLYDRDGIVIEVASKEAMLAMKLRANRPGRDTGDIRRLLALCSLSTVVAVGELYEEFYPGDVLPDRATTIVESILADGELLLPPELPDIDI